MTEVENLKRLLKDAMQWNWIDWEEDLISDEDSARACLPTLAKLHDEIAEALK